MPQHTYDELTPIVPGVSPKGTGRGGPPPPDIEVWPTGPPKPAKAGTGEPIEKPAKEQTTLTDTEKIIDKSDGTAKGVIKRIYEEAKRKATRMKGKAGTEAGSSLAVFKPLIESKINWPKLLKQKVRFFADKVGRKLKEKPSYLMYPWKAQSQVGIIAKAPLRQPEKNYIYLIFAFDTSGSIGEDTMQSIVNELNAVATVFKKGAQGITGKVFAMEWDTAVHQFIEFKPSMRVEVKGGGGTEPKCVFKHIDSRIKQEIAGKYLVELGPEDRHTFSKLPGSRYSSAPLLIIFTDGAFFGKLSKADLGKAYGISENNIFYILTQESDMIYPKNKDSWILYDVPRF